MRAYAFNLDSYADKIAQMSGDARVKLDELPWDGLLSLYGEVGSKIGATGLDGNVATLIEATVGPFAKLLSQVVDGTVSGGLHALAALGVGTNTPLQWVSTQATTREILTGVMDAVAEASGRKARRSAVKLELRRLQILGVNLDQRHSIGFIGIRSDGSLITRASHRSDKAAFIRSHLTGWRRLMNTQVRTGLGAGLLQSFAILQLYKKATGGMQHERLESWARMGAASVGMMGGVLELSGKQMESWAGANLRHARWVNIVRYASAGGKLFSAIGGFAMAVIDFVHAYHEGKEGNETMAVLYVWSGIFGAAMAFAVVMAWFAVAAIFFVAVIALALAIMWFGDTARHDWLERCLWGSTEDPSQKYQQADIEMKEYLAAMGAT